LSYSSNLRFFKDSDTTSTKSSSEKATDDVGLNTLHVSILYLQLNVFRGSLLPDLFSSAAVSVTTTIFDSMGLAESTSTRSARGNVQLQLG